MTAPYKRERIIKEKMTRRDIITFLNGLPKQPMNITIYSENLFAGYTHCDVNGSHTFTFNNDSFFITNGGEECLATKYNGIYQIETGKSYKYHDTKIGYPENQNEQKTKISISNQSVSRSLRSTR